MVAAGSGSVRPGRSLRDSASPQPGAVAPHSPVAPSGLGKSLKTQLTESQAELIAHKELVAELEETVVESRASVERITVERDELSGKHRAAEEKVQELLAELERTTERQADMLRIDTELAAKLSEYEEKAGTLEKMLGRVKKEHAAEIAKVKEDAEKTHASLLEEKKREIARLTAAEEAANSSATELSDLRLRLRSLQNVETELAETAKSYDELSARFSEVLKERNEYHEKLSDLETDLALKDSQLKKVKTLMDVKQWEERVETLNKSLQDAEDGKRTLLNTIDSLTRQINTINTDTIPELRKERDHARELIQTKDEHIQRALDAVTESRDTERQLRREIETERGARLNRDEELKDLREERQYLLQEVAHLKAAVRNARLDAISGDPDATIRFVKAANKARVAKMLEREVFADDEVREGLARKGVEIDNMANAVKGDGDDDAAILAGVDLDAPYIQIQPQRSQDELDEQRPASADAAFPRAPTGGIGDPKTDMDVVATPHSSGVVVAPSPQRRRPASADASTRALVELRGPSFVDTLSKKPSAGTEIKTEETSQRRPSVCESVKKSYLQAIELSGVAESTLMQKQWAIAEKAIGELEEQLADAKAARDTLALEVVRLKGRMDEATRINTELKMHCEVQAVDVDRLVKDWELFQQTQIHLVEDLTKESSVAKAEASDALEKLQVVQRRHARDVEAFERERERLFAEMTTWVLSRKTMQAEVDRLRDALKHRDDLFEEKEKENIQRLKENEDTINTLQNEKTELSMSFEKLLSEAKGKYEAEANLRSKVQDTVLKEVEKVRVMKDTLEKTQHDLATTKEELEACQAKLDEVQTAYDQIKDAHSEKKELEGEFSEFKKKVVSAMETQQQHVVEKDLYLQQLSRIKREALEREIESKKAQEDLKNKILKVMAEKDSVSEAFLTVSKKLSTLRHEQEGNKAQYVSLLGEHSTLAETNESLKKDIEGLTAERNRLQSTLHTLLEERRQQNMNSFALEEEVAKKMGMLNSQIRAMLGDSSVPSRMSYEPPNSAESRVHGASQSFQASHDSERRYLAGQRHHASMPHAQPQPRYDQDAPAWSLQLKPYAVDSSGKSFSNPYAMWTQKDDAELPESPVDSRAGSPYSTQSAL